MKFQKSLLLGLTTGAIALTTTPTFGQSSPGSKVVFRCNTKQDILTTVAYNPENEKEIPLIYWKREYINSQNIRQDCDRAAEKLGKRFESQNPSESNIFLVVENQLLDRNSNNQMIQTIVCLADTRGASCNSNGSNELFRIETKAQQPENQKVLSEILNSDFADLNGTQLRGVARTYPKIKSKTWFERLFSLKI
jgi:hypothetical protein